VLGLEMGDDGLDGGPAAQFALNPFHARDHGGERVTIIGGADDVRGG